MNPLMYCVYVLCVGLIRVAKWIEFQVLRCFTPVLKRKGKELALKRAGIVFHCPDDPEWTELDNEKALASCTRYDTLIHIRVNSNSFFPRVANLGTLAFGEAYMDKTWETTKSDEDITELSKRLLETGLMKLYWNRWNSFLENFELIKFDLQDKKGALQVAKIHYDLGNDLYELMLDKWLQYSCGYWKDAKNLDEAQENKLELIAKKLKLKPGMRVLDVGCGWGMLCKYLAEKHGVECVGVTISEEQAKYAREKCKGLSVEIRLQDYRDVNEKFDRIVSVGMFEHVGKHSYRTYMKVCARCLSDDGIFLLHTISTNHEDVPQSERWLTTYIFPSGMLPRPIDIVKSTFGLFIIEDWHNFGPDYARTLHEWRENFNASWPKIQDNYGKDFYRMWIYYLSMCKGVFLARRTQLWQIVLSKDGLREDYRAPR